MKERAKRTFHFREDIHTHTLSKGHLILSESGQKRIAFTHWKHSGSNRTQTAGRHCSLFFFFFGKVGRNKVYVFGFPPVSFFFFFFLSAPLRTTGEHMIDTLENQLKKGYKLHRNGNHSSSIQHQHQHQRGQRSNRISWNEAYRTMEQRKG